MNIFEKISFCYIPTLIIELVKPVKSIYRVCLTVLFLFLFFISNPFLCAQITVTGANGLAATYPNFTSNTGVFAALNANPNQSGRDILITITSSTVIAESGANALNAGNWNSIKITTNTAGILRGTFSGSLFSFSGADNVTIDGVNSGGVSLIIENRSGATTVGICTIRFFNDACNNTIKNCNIRGAAKSNVTADGGVIAIGTGTTTGNDNITITNCTIGTFDGTAIASCPSKGIGALGSTSTPEIRNSGISITNNNFEDCFANNRNSAGIYINAGNDNWTISGNRFYQTGDRNFTTGTTGAKWIGLGINTGTVNPGSFTIVSNIIGFRNNIGTGVATFLDGANEVRGIDVTNVSTTVATSIQDNTISGISLVTNRSASEDFSSSFTGICLGGFTSVGDGLFLVGNIAGNRIGSLDGSSSIVITNNNTTATAGSVVAPVMGILCLTPQPITINNNSIGSITVNGTGSTTTQIVGITGIKINSSSTSVFAATINNNTIGGSSVASGLNALQGGEYTNYGIYSNRYSVTAQNNIVRYMYSNASALLTTLPTISGIFVDFLPGTTANHIIRSNQCYALTSNSSGTTLNADVYVIDCNATTAVLDNNIVHSVRIISPFLASHTIGMLIRAGTNSVYNNMISLGTDTAGNAITAGMRFTGIRHLGGACNLYHNSVNIGGAGVTGSSLTVAFRSDELVAARNIRNNIFANTRSDVSNGAGNVAIYLAGTTANPAGLTSNNNILFVSGTNGHVGFFNAATRTTLATWQTLTGQDANSINSNPQYIAPNAAVAAIDLHIQSTSPAEALGVPVGILTDYDAQNRSTTNPDVGADEIDGSIISTWVGNISTAWGNSANWNPAVVPNASSAAIINGGFPNLPTVSATQDVKNLTISAGTVTINATGRLRIYGDVTSINNGLNASTGAIEMARTGTAQAISGSWLAGRNLSSLINSNSAGINISSAANDTLRILSSITFGTVSSSIINTGNNLTLVSADTATAFVGPLLNGNAVTGNVTVERFIPNHPRAWQFLAIPTSGSQTIKSAWQEGALSSASNPNPGFGTQLSSNVVNATTVQGFDLFTGSPSMKTYNSVTNGWDGVASTFNPIANQKGYMVFVRGDRSVSTLAQAATNLKLRTTGTLYSPANPPSGTNVSAGRFESVGNPYASAIDFTKVGRTGGVTDGFYVWDPVISGGYGFGTYQAFSRSGSSYNVTPGGGSYTGTNRFIQSGQAFFVTAPTVAGSISFTENVKVSGSALVTRNQVAETERSLCMNLYLSGTTKPLLLDGLRIEFDSSYSKELEDNDMRKLDNFGENIGVNHQGVPVIVDRWSVPSFTDTVALFINQMRQQNYLLEIKCTNLQEYQGMEGLLGDRFLNTLTPFTLADTTWVPFTVNGQPASFAPNRFYITFRPLATVPVLFIAVSAQRNNKEVAIHFSVEQQQNITRYAIQFSLNGNEYYTIGEVPATAATSYAFDHFSQPLAGYYRIVAVDVNGSMQLSKVVRVEGVQGNFSVFPNPVQGKVVALFSPKTTPFLLSVIDEQGKWVYGTRLSGMVNSVSLPQLPAGRYYFVCTYPGEAPVKLVVTLLP